MTDDKWINNLRKEEENFVPEPPVGLWEDIKVDLDTRKQSKALPLWLRWTSISAAACIVVLLGIGILMKQNASPQQEDKISNAIMQGSSSIPNVAVSLVTEDSKQANSSNPLSSKKLLAQTATAETVVFNSSKQDSAILRNVQTDNKIEESCNEKKPQEHQNKKKQYMAYDNWLADASLNHHQRQHARPSFSISVGNIMNDHISSNMGYDSGLLGDVLDGDLPDSPVGDNPLNDMLILNQGKDVSSKIHHKLPIRIGFNIALPVSNRLSIASGVTYSFLSSTIESGTEDNYLNTKQELHYLGIPAKLKYDILRNNQFNVYVSCGGMIEKCVYGKSNTDFVIGGLKSAEEKKKLSEKEVQLSTFFSAGIEASIHKNMSLFAEPGMNYYFDNHSGIENSYKDKPLGFDFKIGLRINIDR